jgi:histidine kinase/DNA gyrase B/HSP90-like ATPase
MSAETTFQSFDPNTLPDEGDSSESFTPNWAPDAPRGGRAVLTRALKDSATVPLFLAQTFIQSLRDVGYNTTTSALEEHVDNAIEAGATEIRIYFRQSGRRGDFKTDVMVYDNGRGMAPNVLKVATSLGGSMSYGNRSAIGRFGMGMKTAALSMSPTMELYSWQESRGAYCMVLDTNAIGRERANVIELPDPRFVGDLPSEVTDLFIRAVNFPKDKAEQHLLSASDSDLWERIGPRGTVVYMPECDRLSFATDRKLVEHAMKEMARVYRRHIAKGLKLYVNNRRLIAFDPTYAMADAWHARVKELRAKTSRLVDKKAVKIQRNESSPDTAEAVIGIYALPIEDWGSLPRKVQKNDLQIFDGYNVSVLRNEREHAGFLSDIAPRHSAASWFRIEIDFPGELDEAFGVAANKQGVRLKSRVVDAINNAVGDQITTLTEEIKRFQSKRAAERIGSALSASEAASQRG